jgi:hypothetical protein
MMTSMATTMARVTDLGFLGIFGFFFFAIFIFVDGQLKRHLHGKMIIFAGLLVRRAGDPHTKIRFGCLEKLFLY